jgi:hypothetical protein
MRFTIDTIVPIFTGTTLSGNAVQSGGIYATGIRFIFSDAYLSGATLSGLNDTNYFSGNFPSNSVITTNGTYLFTVSDLAGNTSSTIFTIDMTKPTASTTPILSSRTSGNVYSSLTGYSEILTGLNATGYLFTGNGSFTFRFSDLAGNTGETIATMTRIDKTAPVVSGITPASGSTFTGDWNVPFSWIASDS